MSSDDVGMSLIMFFNHFYAQLCIYGLNGITTAPYVSESRMFTHSWLARSGCSAVKPHAPEDIFESCSRSVRHNSRFTVAKHNSVIIKEKVVWGHS